MPTSSPYAVAIGSSAGGIESLRKLVAGLPHDFGAPLFIVQHIAPEFKSFLPEILTAAGRIKAKHPRDGERIEAPLIYVAPPDHHLLIEDDRIAVTRGPKENRFRPSVDVLFRSAAYMYRAGAIGVVLSGALNDGTSGLWTIKRLGGTTVVQDPADAPVPSMPLSALREVQVDRTLPIGDVAEMLVSEIARPLKPAPEPRAEELKRLEIERAIARGGFPLAEGSLQLGEPSLYTCPECSGVLSRIVEGPRPRYRCHTGHAYAQDVLLAGLQQGTGERLAHTVTALEESALLLDEISERYRAAGDLEEAGGCTRRAQETRSIADGLRKLIVEDRAGVG